MRRKRPSDRQAEIGDAILRIVGREGIGALTMERLGRDLGVTSGALFRHFPSRAAMLNEAAHRAVALLETTFPPPDLPPLEQLRRFLAVRSRLAAEHVGIPQLVFSEQFGKALPPKGARALRDVVLRTREFLVEVLREAGARGDIRRDVPPEQLAVIVLGAIVARGLIASAAGDGASPPPDSAAAWQSLLTLLGPSAPDPDQLSGGPRTDET